MIVHGRELNTAKSYVSNNDYSAKSSSVNAKLTTTPNQAGQTQAESTYSQNQAMGLMQEQNDKLNESIYPLLIWINKQ